LGPNGNGALFDSLASNEEVRDHISKTDYVQIIGVDNVLNRVLDPVYIGFAVAKRLQAAMKSCVKRDAKEPVGVVVKRRDADTGAAKYDIVEYSEISQSDANAINEATGELKFNLGNILVFILSSQKLLELASNSATLNALYHKAFKKYAFLDTTTGEKVTPAAPNSYKFELFVHNFLPFCEVGRFGVLRVAREDEFAPVKNAEGEDSPATAKALIYGQSLGWLTQAGAKIPEEVKEVEVDTLLSYEGEGLEAWKDKTEVPKGHIPLTD
jgi:UDP-N-acetylglucosamine/UDP-N-acetylgalactosamine diphosphorylase